MVAGGTQTITPVGAAGAGIQIVPTTGSGTAVSDNLINKTAYFYHITAAGVVTQGLTAAGAA
jgi:hypothetical protein